MGLPFLDQWLVRRMQWDRDLPPTSGQLREWQLARLREIVAHAQTNSPFYARHLEGVDAFAIESFDDFSRLPTITPDHMRETPEQLLCVSQDAVARAVTLTSSGTTGPPKRIFHTEEDLEATVDYFAWGMGNIAGKGRTVLVLMPGDRPGGVGRLLVDALTRAGGRAVTHGVMENVDVALDQCLEEAADCVVGSPAHVHMLAHAWQRRGLPKGTIRSVLLCWDAIPEAVAANVERLFGCRVFRHWGMIETGLGGAVECAPGSGMHLREADVFMEIVDPETGAGLPDGEFGEMVVTTPLKRGMPLIRYRTGDTGRILTGQCSCESPLRRLDPLIYRRLEGVATGPETLTLRTLNEALYGVPGLADFAARFDGGRLRLTVCGGNGVSRDVRVALQTVPAVERGRAFGCLEIDIDVKNDGTPAIAGLGKRCIHTDLEK
ncbi:MULTISPECIES: DVU_1553 family AMP-dependent CoA ligase [unclassified Pseudodesulfovibrio]|uniref:DVU_1553 family AMP-dependent CoA ligase n=1 Tax=unclassified Pseudodesulfovibrio TaxID=2661612 RepID=UPI000FEBD8F5|nr:MULTISPECIES: AMP-binding protein [unclassified Pseudodesulfovibrio]MCJ2164781.1 AMP-binding protein [Pseudodesulfovibrio sp. S3-i]RWU04035.1 phenylacetate--CoA ligase family protein [Pseudodesulfovibrio sp. S3]